MKRVPLLKLLRKYNPTAAEEVAFKLEMLTFIKNNVNCFERSLEIGHITASCWLLSRDGSSALMTHHAKLDQWLQLGGHCDGEADVLAVALKEAREESGINEIRPVSEDIFDIDIHLIPANNREKEHFHYDIRFLLQVDSDEQFVVSDESKQLQWVSKSFNELPTENKAVVRMFKKWVNRD